MGEFPYRGLPVLGCVLTLLTFGGSPDYALTSSVSLNMGGTSMSDPGQGYADAMTDLYIEPFLGVSVGPGDRHVVVTPEQLWPISCGEAALNDCLTLDASVDQGVIDLARAIALYPQDAKYILGYSQSTQIQTITKRAIMLAADMAGGGFADYPDVSLSMVSNVDKPNGGILARFSWAWPTPTSLQPLGITAWGPTPTDTPANPADPADYAVDTVNFSFIYDGMGDFPSNPLNLLAVANAIMGAAYLHHTYPFQSDIRPDNPRVFYQGSYQDSAYYMLSTELIPLLRPLEDLGVPRPVLLFLDAPLQVLIETGYEREINPGEPVPFRLAFNNPITVARNLAESVLVGFDDAAAELGYGRPLRTTPAGPFGVGGPTGPIADPTAPPAALRPVTVAGRAAARSAGSQRVDGPGDVHHRRADARHRGDVDTPRPDRQQSRGVLGQHQAERRADANADTEQ